MLSEIVEIMLYKVIILPPKIAHCGSEVSQQSYINFAKKITDFFARYVKSGQVMGKLYKSFAIQNVAQTNNNIKNKKMQNANRENN